MQSSKNPGVHDWRDSDSRLQELLVKTSRTFALAIPQLPQPTRREVTIAYLLFRIADTLEDASILWTRSQQHAALDHFDDLMLEPCLDRARELAARWQADPPSEHPGYTELLAETPFVIESFLGLSPEAQDSIAGHSRRTAQQMADFVTKTAGGVLRLEDIDDLRQYCYAVAGIVGEMLTDLFLLGSYELAPVADYLRARAVAFGEGLQLVNILKDSDSDAVEGRNYLPAGVSRDDVFALARSDLEAATEYSLTLQQAGGPDGVVAFTALPVELAWATLEKVER
ncbi:MAG: squalene/phytoene synthase family protein, partial [Acidobacteriota bacterium]|nr:squalene/phytoene synthase family protein [Acidobacteriota bacterium]